MLIFNSYLDRKQCANIFKYFLAICSNTQVKTIEHAIIRFERKFFRFWLKASLRRGLACIINNNLLAGIPVLRWILFMSSQEDNHRCVVLETVVIWSFINLGFFRHMLLYDHRMRIGGFRHDMRKCGLPFVRLLSVGKMPPLGTHCSKPTFLVHKIDFHKTF